LLLFTSKPVTLSSVFLNIK